jgi:hypothetical protein
LALAAVAPLSAGLLFDNGTPFAGSGTRDLTLFRSADDFVLNSAANVAAVKFWISATAPTVANPQDNFSGTISYAIYNNSAGNLGPVVASGTVNNLVSTPTGIVNPGINTGINVLQFDLVTTVALAAGAYWLELHEGPTFATSDGSNIGWSLSNPASGNAKQGFAVNGVPEYGIPNELAFQLYDTAFATPGAAVPEPSTLGLAGLALAALAIRYRERLVTGRAKTQAEPRLRMLGNSASVLKR